MGSVIILRLRNVRKQAKEVILTEAKNPERSETHINASINKKNCAT